MLEWFKSAVWFLALTVVLALPLQGLVAAQDTAKSKESQDSSTESQATTSDSRRKSTESQAKTAESQTTSTERLTKTEEPQPSAEETETVPEAHETGPSNGMKTFDALAVRPVTFLSSVFSAGAFVLALPFAALDPAMDIEKTRKNLVEEPFQDTFQRPLGEFNGSAW
jgi:hypothetical protein